MFYRFSNSQAMDRAMITFWALEELAGKDTTTFDIFKAGGEGECSVVDGNSEEFAHFLSANRYAYEQNEHAALYRSYMG